MGTWSVVSVNCRHDPLNSATEYGTNWYVTYRIKYIASLMGGFVELPNMAWDEVIQFADYVKDEYWEFHGNMYTRKPDSPTMGVWAQRYFRAYLHAQNRPYRSHGDKQKGHSKLFDKNGAQVPGSALGKHDTMPEQNKAVQDYLKRHGGILEIEVHDIANVLKPAAGKAKRVERVLAFNCGITGTGTRVKAWQYIRMDALQPDTWIYKFQTASSPPGIKTSGLKVVAGNVPQSDLLPQGGIW